ncbi:nucleoside hydrolase [Xaviernesmea oryzae]|uniref:Nucleoside hydrolase n=1 Tax=Xaviernesmea oryzae TaxID=464029 RepID=A0A1Q9AYZ0_9HYPH|nr:nucleoside hydrolase [Xaviernesmea oryzae]OLP60899.1 nucleoside hydrolase [Xaviernesmea oryzae]SEL22400.1 purine nucleosidase [Xaviernesmea oryzae]
MQRIILDVDSAGDDILAVLFAAAHPEIQLEGVTTTTGAAGPIKQVTDVVLNTLSLAGRDHIPVHAGAWRPILGHSKADMEAPVHFEKRLTARFGDRLKTFNPPAPEPKRKATPGHAVDFIIDTAKANPGEITLVTTGPTTNAAMAILQEPELPKLLKNMLVLGGNFTTPGNMTPLSEYNIWADPEAARIVLNADCDKILVPLDICEDNRVADSMLTRDDIADMLADGADNPVIAMIQHVFPIYIDIWREFFGLVGFPMDDVITVALAIAPDLVKTTDPLFMDVVLEKGVARGQTVAYRGHQILPGGDGPKTTRIATGLDGRRFLDMFKTTMARYARAAA